MHPLASTLLEIYDLFHENDDTVKNVKAVEVSDFITDETIPYSYTPTTEATDKAIFLIQLVSDTPQDKW